MKFQLFFAIDKANKKCSSSFAIRVSEVPCLMCTLLANGKMGVDVDKSSGARTLLRATFIQIALKDVDKNISPQQP